MGQDRLATACIGSSAPRRRTAVSGVVVALIVALGALLASSVQGAGVNPFKETLGSSAKPSFTRPMSVAVDQSSGAVLVVEAGVNEVQSLKVSATAGQFKLTVCGETTGDLAFNAAAAVIKAAMEALPCVGVKSPTSVNVTGGTGDATGSKPYTITFQNQMGGRNVEQVITSAGTTPLSGGNPASEAVVTTTTEGVTSGIRRFSPDGSAANFSALESNMIDGQRGPGNKPRAECVTAPEPTSCDETPLNGFVFPATAFQEVQIAIDNSGGVSNGDIYVTQSSRKLVYVFDEDGSYLGQLTAAGVTTFGEICGVAVAPSGALYMGQFSPKVVHKFVPTASPALNTDWTEDITVPATPSSPCQVAAGADSTLGDLFVSKFGSNPVVKMNDAPSVEYLFGSGRLVATDWSNGQVWVAGANSIATRYDAESSTEAREAAKLTAGSTIQGIAVDGDSGNVYVSRAGATNIDVFGPTVFPPVPTAFAASNVKPTEATLNGAVNPQGGAITECVFEYGEDETYGSVVPCEGETPPNKSAHPVSAHIAGLVPNGTTYHFRLVATNDAGAVASKDRSFTTMSTAVTDPATNITDSTAMLNGHVFPEGTALSKCEFEYGLTDAYGESAPCVPSAMSIEPDFQAHSVSAQVTNLAKGKVYHFRLATESAAGVAKGEDRTFTTFGPPVITGEVPQWVDQTTATLQARIKPSGLNTSYHFEWGLTSSYGKSTPPDFDPFVGSGDEPVLVAANLSSLQPGTQYHYRVVAANSSGTTLGPDRKFETLNTCGFTQGRCLEMISPPDKDPVGEAGEVILESQPRFRVAASSSKVAYVIGYGLPDSTAGGEVIYRATRGTSGWSSSQLSPASHEATSDAGGNTAGIIRYLSDELDCAILTSQQLLTADAPRETIEKGLQNMFRRSEDGSYQILTPEVPVGLPSEGQEMQVAGMSSNCDRVLIDSPLEYPGLSSGLYEWDHGVLHDVGVIPTSGGPVSAAAQPGAGTSNYWNAFSTDVPNDESRAFFTATSQQGGNSGKQAIFARIRTGTGLSSVAETVDVSQKDPSTGTQESRGAAFQTASTDGEYVFFLSNYGLAGSAVGPVTTCSGGDGGNVSGDGSGCDLYRYSVETNTLTDLSAVANPANTGGAGVAGVLGASDDGAYVYFAARGQLVPGEGNTYSGNLEGTRSYNVYLSNQGDLSYVGLIAERDLSSAQSTGANVGMWQSTRKSLGSTASRVTPDGRFLLFQSSETVTSNAANGEVQAYLYSADSQQAQCISCRRDQKPSVALPGQTPLATFGVRHVANDSLHPPITLTNDGAQVHFWSPNALAVGAVEGLANLYVWRNGQISLLSAGMSGVPPAEGDRGQLTFAGSSADGDELYFSTPRALLPQDYDQRQDLYVAKMGGGFEPPTPPLPPCDPLIEGACGAGGEGAPPPGVAPVTPSFIGPGNETPNEPSKKKQKKKKKKQKKKKQKSGKKNKAKKSASSRYVNQDRRAGK